MISDTKKIELIEKEYELIQHWFAKYDQIVGLGRGWIVTIYLALIIHSFKSGEDFFMVMLIFALFFWSFEGFWLYRYWFKRAKRDRTIQLALCEKIFFEEFKPITIDQDLSKTNLFVFLKKIDEPSFFYFGLIVISFLIFKFC